MGIQQLRHLQMRASSSLRTPHRGWLTMSRQIRSGTVHSFPETGYKTGNHHNKMFSALTKIQKYG